MTVMITATREINPTATKVTIKTSLLFSYDIFWIETPSSFMNLNPGFPLIDYNILGEPWNISSKLIVGEYALCKDIKLIRKSGIPLENLLFDR